MIEEVTMAQADGAIARLDAKTGGGDVEPIYAEFTVSTPEDDSAEQEQ